MTFRIFGFRLGFLFAMALWLGLPAGLVPARGETAPRLFLGKETLQRIRHRVRHEPESHEAQAFSVLRARVERADLEDFQATETNWNYARAYLAQSAAFAWQVTREPRYAEQAYEILRAVHAEPGPDRRFPESGDSGLSRATVGMGFALAYDWCADAWTDNQRGEIREKIEAALTMWESYAHRNLGGDRKSNWTAVCRGGELLLLLAIREETARAARYEFLIEELMLHLKNGYDEIGASQEGSGYMAYGGIFLLPAIYAARDAGDSRLFDFLQAERRFDRKMMYAGSFASVPAPGVLENLKMFPASGVGGPNLNDEGFASLVTGMVPAEDLPEYLWWYDRHMGRLAEPRDRPELHFEPRRQGTVWSIVFYPELTETRDPAERLPAYVTGQQGRFYIRNRWRDADDLLFAVHADSKWLPRAWSQGEAGLLSLLGYGRFWIGGPRRDRDGEAYSKLLVDGQPGSSNATGAVKRVEPIENGVYVVIDGGVQYAELGPDRTKRHMLLDFGPPDANQAVWIVLDQVDAYQAHTYTWNVRIAAEDRLGDWGVRARAPAPHAFELHAPNAPGRVRGWLLHEAETPVTVTDSRVFFEHQGRSAEFLTVMSVHPDNAPESEVLRNTPLGVLFQVGDRRYAYDRMHGRLLTGDTLAELDLEPNRPLPVRGLRAQVRSDQSVLLAWYAREYGADALVVEKAAANDDGFVEVKTLPPDQHRIQIDGLTPGQTYRFRVRARFGDARDPDPETVEVQTWEAGRELIIEDFAPGEDGAFGRIGPWEFHNQDERGWQWSAEAGSPRGAEDPRGMIETEGRVRIDQNNLFLTRGFHADFSGDTAAVEMDFQTQGTTRFGLMLLLADGRWIRTEGLAHLHSRRVWGTHRWNLTAVDSWVQVDPGDFSVGDPVEVTDEDLKTVRGLGFWGQWPMNERWARIDQLHLYVRDFHPFR